MVCGCEGGDGAGEGLGEGLQGGVLKGGVGVGFGGGRCGRWEVESGEAVDEVEAVLLGEAVEVEVLGGVLV